MRRQSDASCSCASTGPSSPRTGRFPCETNTCPSALLPHLAWPSCFPGQEQQGTAPRVLASSGLNVHPGGWGRLYCPRRGNCKLLCEGLLKSPLRFSRMGGVEVGFSETSALKWQRGAPRPWEALVWKSWEAAGQQGRGLGSGRRLLPQEKRLLLGAGTT